MKFGLMYELQIPKPWDDDSEYRIIREATEQVVLGDKLGIDHAWAVEHHFLEIFGREVLPHFAADRDERLARKAEQLAPFIEAAMARKQYMAPLADDEIPIVPPSRERESYYRKP